jgi:hypothetical protein
VSFILDALRKSDRRRRMQDAPDLSTSGMTAAAPQGRRPRRFRGALLLALLLIVAIAAVLAWTERDRIEEQWTSWVGADGNGTSEGAPQSPEPIVPAADGQGDAAQASDEAVRRERGDTPRERVVTDPEAARREVERLVAAQREASPPAEPSDTESEPRRGQSVSRAAPRRDRTPAASPEQVAEIERRLAEAQRRRELAAAEAEKESEEAEASAGEGQREGETSWAPEAAEYVRAWELPLSIRRNLPALNLSIHVFSEQAEERFVLINGVRYIIGDELPEGARLVDIRREGAIVDYRDYRFLLEP